FRAEDGIRDFHVTGVQTCALPISLDIDPYYLAKRRRGVIEEFLQNIKRHKLVITDRYHGTIFAIAANTPVIVLGSTDHKLSSGRSEEHTSELQSRENLVCRLLLEK